MTNRRQRELIVRPLDVKQDKYIVPVSDGVDDCEAEQDEGEEAVVENKMEEKQVVDTDTRPTWENMYDHVEDLNVRVVRHFEDANDNTGWQPPMVAASLQPIKQEWLRHQLAHTPYARWCRHCSSARAVRNNHQSAAKRARLVPDTDDSVEGPVKISMDYMYMHERIGKYAEPKWSPPYLVVVEHRYGRVWAYQTPNKGPQEESCWLPGNLFQDWDDSGFKELRVRLKTDQEPAMIKLQEAIQQLRSKEVLLVNSPFGESESNGRVENAIRRIQEKTRVLRRQLEENIKRRIPDTSPIMAWLVRWAAELLSKYSCGDDGKSPSKRMHGEKCLIELVPFGESILYLPLKTMRRASRGGVAANRSSRRCVLISRATNLDL